MTKDWLPSVPPGWTLTAAREGTDIWFELWPVGGGDGSGSTMPIPLAHLLALPKVFRARVQTWMDQFIAAHQPVVVKTRQIDLND